MVNSFILLTGMPGCGKTTIVKKIIEDLRKNGINNLKGFYTSECRDSNGERTGFDIHSFYDDNGTIISSSAALARISSAKPSIYKVGKYNVYVDEFEDSCMKLMENDNKSLLIIDEIGKMELFSKKFERFIRNLLQNDDNLKILATVPLKAPMKLIEQLKSHKNSQLFHITKSNRDEIYSEIYQNVQKMLAK